MTKMNVFFYITILWTLLCVIYSHKVDYDDILESKTKIDIVTEKGKKWSPRTDYYCKYRVYHDYSSRPCFCLSMTLNLKYSYNTSKEIKRIETKIPDAYWVHGYCFSKSIYVTISWPKYDLSELVYFEPPKENFVLMIFKKNQTHVWLDELSISMNHENGNVRRPNKLITVSDTFLHLNFTTNTLDGIYVCDRPLELKGWLGIMDIVIEDLRFTIYNGVKSKTETQCPKFPH